LNNIVFNYNVKILLLFLTRSININNGLLQYSIGYYSPPDYISRISRLILWLGNDGLVVLKDRDSSGCLIDISQEIKIYKRKLKLSQFKNEW